MKKNIVVHTERIFITNAELEKWFFAAVIINGIFFIHANRGHLMKLDPESNVISVIDCDDPENLLIKYQSAIMLHVKDDIYMVDNNRRAIIRYNMIDNSCHRVFCVTDDDLQTKGLIESAYVYGESVFCFFINAPGFIEIKEGKIDYIKPSGVINSFEWAGSKSIRMGDCIYFLFSNSDKYSTFDLRGQKYGYGKHKGLNGNCVDVSCDNGVIYILLDNGNCCRWNPLNGREELKTIIHVNSKVKNNCYRVSAAGEYVYLMPGAGTEIVVSKENSIGLYNDYPANFHCILPIESQEIYYKYLERTEDDMWVYYSARFYSHILCIRKTDGMIKWIEMMSPETDEEIRIHLMRQGIINENQGYIESFLKHITTA